jgi:hypothetical protein
MNNTAPVSLIRLQGCLLVTTNLSPSIGEALSLLLSIAVYLAFGVILNIYIHTMTNFSFAGKWIFATSKVRSQRAYLFPGWCLNADPSCKIDRVHKATKQSLVSYKIYLYTCILSKDVRRPDLDASRRLCDMNERESIITSHGATLDTWLCILNVL